MSQQMHVIRRQSLELELAPGQDAHQLQEQIKEIFTSQVAPILDAIMSQQVAQSELLRINRLELDLGTLDAERLEEQLPERLRQHFEHALAAEISQAARSDPEEIDTTARQQAGRTLLLDLEQSELQLLIHYLRTGLLPWWNPEQPAFDLNGIFSRQLEQQQKPLLQAMRRLPPGRVAARLSRQLSSPLLERLVLALAEEEHTESEKIPRQILAAITESSKPLSAQLPKAAFEQLLHQLLQPTSSTGQEKTAWLAPMVQRLVNEHGLNATSLYERLAPLAHQSHPLCHRIVQWLEKHIRRSAPSSTQEQIERSARDAAEKSTTLSAEDASTDPQKTSRLGEAKSDVPAATPADRPKGADASESQAGIGGKSIMDSPADTGMAEENSSFTKPVPHEPALSAAEIKRVPDSEVAQDRKPTHGTGEAEGLVELEQGLYLNNAGLVLLWPYLPRFFRAIQLVDTKDFITEEARERGLLMLQYLACGKTEFQEHELLLNKLFCCWPLLKPVTCTLDIQDHERAEAGTLLNAVIENWKSLKKTSQNGFRTAFLQREGRLSQDDTGWQLKINRVGVDILLESLPWGIGLIRLPWMKDAIQVEW